jgi:serine/threonine protein kinase
VTFEALPKLDRYHLIRRLAAGGMAEVFLGQRVGPSGFQKRVAIKFLMPSLSADPTFLQMFLDEARLVAMFHHPNLVQIFDVGEIDGRICMVMEYVDGGSLAQLIRQAAALGASGVPPVVSLAMLAQACDGLESAHCFRDPATGESLGFVHRDISPHNLLVTREGLVKVADFGISKSTTNLHVTSATELKGKISYMAPEQIHRSVVDRRVDVWALGVVLFELLAGRRLFSGGSEAQLLKAVVDEPLDGAILEVPEDLRPLVGAALQRDPDKRIQSAGELGRQLKGWLDANNGSLDTAAVARWIDPYLPPPHPDDYTPSKRIVEEPVSLPTGNLEPVSLTTEREPGSIRRWVVGAFALLAAVTFALVWRPLHHELPPPAAVATLPPAAPLVAPVPTPAPIRLHVASSPAGALVFAPGSPAPLGRTPLDLIYAAGTAVPAQLALQLPGYVSAQVHPQPQGGDLEVALAPATTTVAAKSVGPAKSSRPPAARRGTHKSTPEQPAEPEGDDDDVGLVNPFHGK